MATYTDTFTGTDTTQLPIHDNGQGWSWVSVSNGTQLTIQDNKCQGNLTNNWAVCETDFTPTATIEAGFDYVQKGSRNGAFRIDIRKPSGTPGGYRMELKSNGVSELLRLNTDGSTTSLGTASSTVGVGEFKLEAIGGSLRVLKDDSAIITASDDTFVDASPVRLSIYDSGGPQIDNLFVNDIVVIIPPKPRGAFRRDGLTLYASADATKVNALPATYEWDWGDESDPDTGVSASHTYDEAGTYEVTLTVTDDNDDETSRSYFLTITEADLQPTLDTTGAVSDPASNWSDTSSIGQIGTTDEPGVDRTAFGKFTRWRYEEASGLFYVGVKAYHMNGIDRVEFSVNSGPWAQVIRQSLNPDTLDYEYVCVLDPTDFGNDELVEIRARLYPTAGQGKVLQDSDGTEANFNASLWIRCNVTNRETIYLDSGAGVNGTGTSGSPFNIMRSALDAARVHMASGKPVTLVCTPDGDGDIDYENGPLLNTSGTAWLTIQHADGYSKANTTLTLGKAVGSVVNASSGLMRVRFLDFDVDTTPQATTEALGNRVTLSHGLFIGCDIRGTLHYYSQLDGAIDDSQTTISLVDASDFPETGTDVAIWTGEDESAETISWTGKSGNDLTGVTRGSNSSTAQAHASGSQVSSPGYQSTYFLNNGAMAAGLEDCTLTDLPYEAGIMRVYRAIRNTLTRVCENGVISPYAIDTTINSILNSGHRDAIQFKGGSDRIIDGLFNLEENTQTSLDDPNSGSGVSTIGAYYGRIYSKGINSVGINFGENSDGIFGHIIVDQCSLPNHSINFRDAATTDILVRRCVADGITFIGAITNAEDPNIEVRDCYVEGSLPTTFSSGSASGSGDDETELYDDLDTGLPAAGSSLKQTMFQEDSFAQRDMNGVAYSAAIGAFDENSVEDLTVQFSDAGLPDIASARAVGLWVGTVTVDTSKVTTKTQDGNLITINGVDQGFGLSGGGQNVRTLLDTTPVIYSQASGGNIVWVVAEGYFEDEAGNLSGAFTFTNQGDNSSTQEPAAGGVGGGAKRSRCRSRARATSFGAGA